MSPKTCQICSRDISKPSLVRCQASACPLNKSAPPASRQTLLGIVGLGLGIVGAIGAASWLFATPGASRTSVASPFSRGTVNNWIDGLWQPKAPDSSPSVPQVAGADWGAATRVETFSCEGRLSAARSVICTHWDLATVDYNLALVYRHALSSARDPGALRAEQGRWLARLDSIDATPETVMEHYRARLDQLQAANPKLAAQ